MNILIGFWNRERDGIPYEKYKNIDLALKPKKGCHPCSNFYRDRYIKKIIT